ncbi:transcriptional regulator [Janibacter sp. Soil728]|uniref:winged helix-turn-helix transcriptional regulator n=1 Tax=Janibacter sp. Soil728 TaxID=1736393 RepID=UPI0006F61B76|nr:response regulator transcription factor [Janibacter sp. Soil728]KRE36114.1 transcriptional regulator [Janibacter sp. Soil728]
MARLLLLTDDLAPSAAVLPALGLLGHQVRTLPAAASAVMDTTDVDVVLVDARVELAQARSLCRVLRTAEIAVPVIAILTEGGLTAVNAEWAVDDILLDRAGPAEVEARLRLSMTRAVAPSGDDERIVAGDLTIDESSYSARLGPRLLNLTYKEFELLKHLAQDPGRVFTRAQLLQEVWGYDYYGGTRTVDVHVRRLRAKLGSEHEQLIGTIRNVGYRFVVVRDDTGGDMTAGDNPTAAS